MLAGRGEWAQESNGTYINDIEKSLLPQNIMTGGFYNCIVTMLPNSPYVKSLFCGENGIGNLCKKDTLVIDMTSGAPGDSKEIYAELKNLDVHFVDAPVSGGEPMAIVGTLAIMVGVNVGVPVPVGIFPFCGHKNSFFGDLHAHGKDFVRFFTESKTVTSFWFDEEEKKNTQVDTWDGAMAN